MLATYRELTNEEKDILDEHMHHCDACAQEYAQSKEIASAVKALPQVELSPNAHDRLMQALAAEHVRFLQHAPASAISTPTPAFLAPYIKDLAPKKPAEESLAAFSTANTGPLPVINIARHTKHRRPGHMSHVAVIGLVASFLLVLMLSGFGSLLLLANQGGQHNVTSISSGGGAAIVVKPLQVSTNQYTMNSAYAHIASAVSNGQHIYSTSYTDDEANWMLEQSNLDATNQASVDLLSTSTSNPIFVLSSSQDWLFWLQLDKATQKNGEQVKTLAGNWSLHALYIGSQPTTDTNTNSNSAKTTAPDATKSLTLHQDMFKPTKDINWTTSPIQGTWLYQDHLIVAYLDSKGTSHLVNYEFSQDTLIETTELASAHDGHVLTTPTASSNGSSIYWSEEWLDSRQDLQSNIWTRQVEVATPAQNGRWSNQTKTETYLFRKDGVSFQPHVVNDTLFFLSASAKLQVNPQASATSTAKGTATATSTHQPVATATAITSTTATPTAIANAQYLGGSTKADPTVLAPQIDATVAGYLITYSADGAVQQQSPINNAKEVVSDLQSGDQYIIWQNTSGNFEMYDVVSSSSVIIEPNDIAKNAAFLAVNGNTALWTPYVPVNAKTSNAEHVTITFGAFQWPSAKNGSGS